MRERESDWLAPKDLGDVILETVQQNATVGISKISADCESMKRM
jgi:hypothetical protein